jgi:tripartite-type tricarboxylate transporter receptor subunit TctC
MIADAMRDALGRPVIVNPKLGAAQRLAVGETRRAAPDGRTLVFTTSSVFTLHPHVYKKLDYDVEEDFTPIAGVARFEVAIAVSATSPIQTYAQLIDSLRKQGPGATYGTAPGAGSLSHFIGASMGMQSNLQLTQVGYKDSAAGLVDLVGGTLPVLVSGYPALVELHRAGRIRMLTVAGDARSPLTPEVPTFREVGLSAPGSTTMMLAGPARMAPDLVARLHAAVQPIFSNPSIKEKLNSQAVVMSPMTPAALAQLLRTERRQMGEIVKASGYVPE